MVTIGIAQGFILDFVLWRRSARPALRGAVRDWFDGLAKTLGSAAAAAEGPERDASLADAASGAAGLEVALKDARARLNDARHEPPCQARLDAETVSSVCEAISV